MIPVDKRAALLLVGETIDDRRLTVSVLCEGTGTAVSVSIPTSRGHSPARVRIGQQLLVLAESGRERKVTPVRFAAVAAVEVTTSITTLLLELKGRPTVHTVGLVQAFAEARSLSTDRGRLHLDGPPIASASADEDAWHDASERLFDLDPDGYQELAFLTVEPAESNNLRVLVPAQKEDRLAGLTVAYLDSDGGMVAEAAAAPRLVIPDVSAVRAEIRHRTIRGMVHLPVRPKAATSADVKGSAPQADQPIRGQAVEPSVVLGGFEAFGLFQLLETKSTLEPAVLADVAERLRTVAPDDTRLTERQAKAHLEAGHAAAAVGVLRTIPEGRRSGHADALLLLAELELGSYDVALDRYGRADFDDWTFGRLVDAVGRLPPAPAASVTEALMMVLSEPRAAALIARVGLNLPAGASLIEIAGRISSISPGDAVQLLRRAGDISDLPTDLVRRLFTLQLANDGADVGGAAIEYVRRLCATGALTTAAMVGEQARHRLHWREAQALADVLLDHLVKGEAEWTDDRALTAMSAASLMQDAIRGLKDVDLGEAIEVAARLRQVLEPAPSEISEPLTAVEVELFTALESTEAHRAALEELNQATLVNLRAMYKGKRVFVVGGRQPSWFEELAADLALDRNSSWREVEPGRRPSMDWLKARVGGGRIDVLVVITDYIAHATSAIAEFAEARDTPVAKARGGRFSFLTALRNVPLASK